MMFKVSNRYASRLAGLGLIAIASQAHASWTLTQADAHATTIHDTSVYEADVGQRFASNDIVETASAAGLQIQNDSGDVAALGPGTRVLLARDAHIALLQGWMKLLHGCGGADCTAPVIETQRGRYTPGVNAAIVIAASPPGYDDADALFCESGSVSVLPPANVRGKPAAIQLSANQFIARRASGPSTGVAPRPDAAFLAAMPVAFRDALHLLPAPKVVHDKPSETTRPVSYDDVSDWLQSSLGVRTQPGTRFTDRFRPRLSDAAFRHDIDQHLGTLPEWRALLYPPPPRTVKAPGQNATPRSAASSVPSVYRSMFLRP
ncbi:hypothetical protein [Paraburkholderia rhizosphaerae]|uniref:FecR family protein n=1 Tax=Paraburkholderia rhizosphaerae TaxID=480658 RepID=A0A4R8LX51_9BURK|nr:hypothetical protein [Paraburkholderia rhizosphaerae]TDY52766.1 hypothetical protein BX592_10448 [Paraburkholderia rhizosphaerae]